MYVCIGIYTSRYSRLNLQTSMAESLEAPGSLKLEVFVKDYRVFPGEC